MRRTNRLTELTYRLSQTARVGWFAAHYLAARRIGGPLTPEEEPDFRPSSSVPNRQDLTRELRRLFDTDLENIRNGIYAAPHDMVRNPVELIESSVRFLTDVPKVDRRRLDREYSEVKSQVSQGRYPNYFLQNFHYQTDGYLSKDSAEIYDFQVETLFSGTADAMRRQALVPVYNALKEKDQRRCRLLDVATGTGRFLTFVKDNYPRLPVAAVDLSPDYVSEARRTLRRWRDVLAVQANAESLPFAEGSYDIVTCIYLFHELPPKVRRTVARQISDQLAPGGTFVFVDSLQNGDIDNFDGLLEMFPVGFHEPYYTTYLDEDLTEMFGDVGLELETKTTAFLSKVVTFRKSARNSGI